MAWSRELGLLQPPDPLLGISEVQLKGGKAGDLHPLGRIWAFVSRQSVVAEVWRRGKQLHISNS